MKIDSATLFVINSLPTGKDIIIDNQLAYTYECTAKLGDTDINLTISYRTRGPPIPVGTVIHVNGDFHYHQIQIFIYVRKIARAGIIRAPPANMANLSRLRLFVRGFMFKAPEFEYTGKTSTSNLTFDVEVIGPMPVVVRCVMDRESNLIPTLPNILPRHQVNVLGEFIGFVNNMVKITVVSFNPFPYTPGVYNMEPLYPGPPVEPELTELIGVSLALNGNRPLKRARVTDDALESPSNSTVASPLQTNAMAAARRGLSPAVASPTSNFFRLKEAGRHGSPMGSTDDADGNALPTAPGLGSPAIITNRRVVPPALNLLLGSTAGSAQASPTAAVPQANAYGAQSDMNVFLDNLDTAATFQTPPPPVRTAMPATPHADRSTSDYGACATVAPSMLALPEQHAGPAVPNAAECGSLQAAAPGAPAASQDPESSAVVVQDHMDVSQAASPSVGTRQPDVGKLDGPSMPMPAPATKTPITHNPTPVYTLDGFMPTASDDIFAQFGDWEGNVTMSMDDFASQEFDMARLM